MSKWFIDNKKTEKSETETKEITPIIEVEDSINTEIIKPSIQIPKEDPYWD